MPSARDTREPSFELSALYRWRLRYFGAQGQTGPGGNDVNVMTMITRVWERVDGILEKERVLDWMRRSGISREQVDLARRVLPDQLHPDQHDHLLIPFGFDREARIERIRGNP